MSRPVEVVTLADMEIAELLQGNVNSARDGQVLRLSYGLENCQAGRVDGLGNAVHGVCCWVTTSELGTIFDVVEPVNNRISRRSPKTVVRMNLHQRRSMKVVNNLLNLPQHLLRQTCP